MNKRFGIILALFAGALEMAAMGGVAEEGVLVQYHEGQVETCAGILEAHGIGKAPRGRSRAQARLLAERAAKVQAYRNLLKAVDRLNPILVNGAGLVSQTGYIRGAKFVEKQYRPSGEVEVKAVLDVSFMNQDMPCSVWMERKIVSTGYSVVIVETQDREITERDWIELNS